MVALRIAATVLGIFSVLSFEETVPEFALPGVKDVRSSYTFVPVAATDNGAKAEPCLPPFPGTRDFRESCDRSTVEVIILEKSSQPSHFVPVSTEIQPFEENVDEELSLVRARSLSGQLPLLRLVQRDGRMFHCISECRNPSRVSALEPQRG